MFFFLFFLFFNLGLINLEKDKSLQHTDRLEVEVASFQFKNGYVSCNGTIPFYQFNRLAVLQRRDHVLLSVRLNYNYSES